MSDHTEAGRLDRRAADRLLDGAGGPAPPGTPPDGQLRALLASAAAPGRAGELAGEDAAVAAFRAAPAPARTSRLAVLRRFLTAKVIALVGGSILLTGGVAYATGHFPGQSPAPAPAPTHGRHGGGGDSSPATEYPPPRRSGSPPSPSPTASGQHGKSSAPGQQKKQRPSPNPRGTNTPPRGPGSNNGNVGTPTAKPTKGNGVGTNKSSPIGGNSGNGLVDGNGLVNGNAKH
ncbi:hypothetical protein [Actinomadura monticuli]|uniref:Translation initiation factor IF-2 n=1 Tax=Actinomadura monticuli TaxID=3097367 RepID=A0ABV4QAX0_9ACTN